MKKQGKQKKRGKPQSKPNKAASASVSPDKTEVSSSRRHFLSQIRTAAIAIPVVGAVGYYSISSIQASISEGDLTKIGNGRPAIVQIHDPQCNLCRTLQSQTRDVLDAYDTDTFEYLVANIKTKKGSDLAVRYSVPHVTLLFFDPSGNMVRIVRGPTSKASLENLIGAHIEKYG